MLSRVGDSLYWMSRYLERAEHTARLIDVDLQLRLDYSLESGVGRWMRLFDALQVTVPEGKMDAANLAYVLALERSNSSSISLLVRATTSSMRAG